MKRFLLIVLALLMLFTMLGGASPASDFAPRDARDGNLQALSCLGECAFSFEYGSSEGKLLRWVDEIKVYVAGRPSADDLKELDAFLMELSFRVPLLPIVTRVDSEAEANIVISYVPLADMKDCVWNYAEGNWGYFSFRYFLDGRMSEARIAIATDVTNQRQRNHLMREELVGALGLTNDHELYADSIVYQPWTEVQELSEIDWLMLNMVYSPYVSPGMTYRELCDALTPTIAP